MRVSVAVMMALLAGVACAQGSQRLTVQLVGDSTMTDDSGYGLGFCANLTEAVKCVDSAKGGASTKTYRAEGLWDKALAEKSDYMLIQLGHNDVDSGTHLPRNTTLPEYETNLRRFVAEAEAMGIHVVLVTPLARRYFQPDGSIHDDLDAHVAVVKKLAKELSVPLIDLHGESVALLQSTGPKSQEMWGRTKQENGETRPDKTHLNPTGSFVFGRMVAVDLGHVVPALGMYVKPDAAVVPTTEARTK